jgi:hypothetical protein
VVFVVVGMVDIAEPTSFHGVVVFCGQITGAFQLVVWVG